VCGTAQELAEQTFAPLSVLLAEAAPPPPERRTPGLPDEAFSAARCP
jgi:precorrin-6Y C5,15-methyltransferase (decarboxylating)